VSGEARVFRLAPMDRVIYWMTVALLFLPVGMTLAGLMAAPRDPKIGAPLLAGTLGPAMLVSTIYAWIWLRFRPTRFVVTPDAVEILWPLKRRRIPRLTIESASIIDRAGLQRLAGLGMRVGAGGLWGGFGWYWSTRRGRVQMYVSRTDRFVWIERGPERPWLVTPEQPEQFVEALTERGVRRTASP
jgi:hypothetical protein